MADHNDRYRDSSDSTVVNLQPNPVNESQIHNHRDSLESYHDNPNIASIVTNAPLLYTSFNGPDEAQILCGSNDGDEDNGCRMERSSSQPLKKLWIAIVISLTFFAIELIGGIIAGSLALLSDSFHLLSDVVSFGISLLSIYLAQRPATKALSYGYHRAEILGALVSIFLIWLLTLYLCIEAYDRLQNPVQVDGKTMCVVAVIGENDNTPTTLIQENSQREHGGNKEGNVNVRAALLHVLGDFLSSLGVLISAIVIMIDPNKVWVDPICTFIFSALVMITTYGVFRSSIRVLMEATPLHIDSFAVRRDLEAIKGVESVHDLHIWDLTVGRPTMPVLPFFVVGCKLPSNCIEQHSESSDVIYTWTTLTAHIRLYKYDPDVHAEPFVPNEILLHARRILKQRYGISHVTIQIE
ncbi:7613_t:CDS:2 [Cetraspora pellucida]|uniref:7613_t:CDS:1 n=1 Tax=Cetraspora pellucida TaxID=1433469 RepID=A0A9N9FSY1_9GLOM|nr:7613_t:CDS:2 [Cetraspora pellucida]